MLMNAQPRVVSTGFDTIVPIYRADRTNRRFIAVMDNNSNAWSIHKPVNTTGNDTWNEQMEELGRDETQLVRYVGPPKENKSLLPIAAELV
jgi:hypothetical protein